MILALLSLLGCPSFVSDESTEKSQTVSLSSDKSKQTCYKTQENSDTKIVCGTTCPPHYTAIQTRWNGTEKVQSSDVVCISEDSIIDPNEVAYSWKRQVGSAEEARLPYIKGYDTDLSPNFKLNTNLTKRLSEMNVELVQYESVRLSGGDPWYEYHVTLFDQKSGYAYYGDGNNASPKAPTANDLITLMLDAIQSERS